MKIHWLDLETTGLDPQKETILEIAVMEADLSRPFETRSICDSAIFFPKEKHESLTPFIREMHTKNGLLEACSHDSCPTIPEVERWLIDCIPEVLDREDMPTLAGSTVHFDHAFLRVHMPTLAARFSHRHYDVSAVKLFCRSLGMDKPPKAEAHRAHDDILESIDHARLCARWLGGLATR